MHMRPEVVLTFRRGEMSGVEVAVEARRFTIGRSAVNDLVVADLNVAHHHVLIENFGGDVLIYDCQSDGGTRLNGVPLGTRGGVLRDGDVITLGGACDLVVTLRSRDSGARASERVAPRDTRTSARRPAPTSSSKMSVSPRVIRVGVAACLGFFFVAAALFMLARQSAAPGNVNGNAGRVITADNRTTANVADGGAANSDGGGGARAEDDAGPASNAGAHDVSDEEIARAAESAVQLASGDFRSCPVPTEVLPDIRQQVEAYRQSPAMRAEMASMRRGARAVAAEARRVGLEPQLVFYAALARSGEGGDASARALALVPQLKQLRTTFGDDADSTLIVVAAYTSGVGTRQSHPLLQTIKRFKPNPFTERNVWFLHSRGGLSDAAYRFVIHFIAAGIVAEDPARYGLPQGRLSY
jgi:hypothetical protein